MPHANTYYEAGGHINSLLDYMNILKATDNSATIAGSALGFVTILYVNFSQECFQKNGLEPIFLFGSVFVMVIYTFGITNIFNAEEQKESIIKIPKRMLLFF